MKHDDETDEVTRLLFDSSLDAAERASKLMPHVYLQLRAIAQKQMSTERADHTLQPTALVNEAFLKLAQNREVPWQSRAHFCVAAAEAMRQILVDHARMKNTQKRDGTGRDEDGKSRPASDHKRLPIDILELAESGDSGLIESLHEAMQRLKVVDPELAEIVQLRFYAGRTMHEVSMMLDLPERTLDRRWKLARAWLFRELRPVNDETRRANDPADA